MTDPNDYARGSDNFCPGPSHPCPGCSEPTTKIGSVLTRTRSVDLWGCAKCQLSPPTELTEMAGKMLGESLKQEQPVEVVGMIWKGQAFKLVWRRDGNSMKGSLVPVAHPDDVWG